MPRTYFVISMTFEVGSKKQVIMRLDIKLLEEIYQLKSFEYSEDHDHDHDNDNEHQIT